MTGAGAGLGELLRGAVFLRPEGRLTAADAWEHAAALRRRLGPHCRPGMLIPVLQDSCFEILASLLAVWSLGCVPCLVTDSAARGLLPESGAVLADHPLPFFLDGAGCPVIMTQECGAGGEFPEFRTSMEDLPLLQCTSGSTGTPKTVVRSLGSFLREAAIIPAIAGGISLEGRLCCSTVPVFHAYGLMFRFIFPLWAGMILLDRRVNHQEELEGLTRIHRDPVLITSPSFMRRLGPGRIDLALAVSAGGMLPPELLERIRGYFASPMLEILGSTETGVMAWRHPETGTELWHMAPDARLLLEPEQDGELAGGLPAGHMCVDSRHCEEHNAVFTDPATGREIPVFRSEDLVELHSDGFRLLGRRSRIVKIEDKLISLDSVERALCRTGLVSDAAVVSGSTDCREITAACAVLSAQGRELRDSMTPGRFAVALRQAVRQYTEPVAVPRRLIFLDELPRTPTGKTDYPRIRELTSGEAAR